MCKVWPIELELIDGAIPYHAKPYPIPRELEEQVKKQLDRLVSIGVLKKHFSELYDGVTWWPTIHTSIPR